jgi:predicted DNA-binding transcriptional regulator AlpA
MPADKLQDHLAYAPRGMRAERAAAYLGMSRSTFLEMVEAGDLPPAKRKRGMSIWDRLELDAAFDDWEDSRAMDPHDARQILRGGKKR